VVAALPDVVANVAFNVAAYTIASEQNTRASQQSMRAQASILTPDQEAMMYETLQPASGMAPLSLTALPGIPSESDSKLFGGLTSPCGAADERLH